MTARCAVYGCEGTSPGNLAPTSDPAGVLVIGNQPREGALLPALGERVVRGLRGLRPRVGSRLGIALAAHLAGLGIVVAQNGWRTDGPWFFMGLTAPGALLFAGVAPAVGAWARRSPRTRAAMALVSFGLLGAIGMALLRRGVFIGNILIPLPFLLLFWLVGQAVATALGHLLRHELGLAGRGAWSRLGTSIAAGVVPYALFVGALGGRHWLEAAEVLVALLPPLAAAAWLTAEEPGDLKELPPPPGA